MVCCSISCPVSVTRISESHQLDTLLVKNKRRDRSVNILSFLFFRSLNLSYMEYKRVFCLFDRRQGFQPCMAEASLGIRVACNFGCHSRCVRWRII